MDRDTLEQLELLEASGELDAAGRERLAVARSAEGGAGETSRRQRAALLSAAAQALHADGPSPDVMARIHVEAARRAPTARKPFLVLLAGGLVGRPALAVAASLAVLLGLVGLLRTGSSTTSPADGGLAQSAQARAEAWSALITMSESDAGTERVAATASVPTANEAEALKVLARQLLELQGVSAPDDLFDVESDGWREDATGHLPQREGTSVGGAARQLS